MGRILSGVLGGFSGKVGPVVGAKWKSIDYMRSYVVPANPNTTGQQTVRTKFSALVVYARLLLATILQTYWDPFYSSMSGFNAFISQNYSKLSVGNLMDTDCIITKGTLAGDAITTAVKSSGSLTISFVGDIIGNGLSTDKVQGVVINNESKIVYLGGTSDTRADASTIVSVTSADDPGDLVAYLFFYRGTGSELVVSDSSGHTVS